MENIENIVKTAGNAKALDALNDLLSYNTPHEQRKTIFNFFTAALGERISVEYPIDKEQYQEMLMILEFFDKLEEAFA